MAVIAKLKELLSKSAEELAEKFAEEDLNDAFNNIKDQAKADIRAANKAIRNLQTEITSVRKNPKAFKLGVFAEKTLDFDANKEKVNKMIALYKEYFNEDFVD
jgi:predicted RNA-binding protein with EMAP domain